MVKKADIVLFLSLIILSAAIFCSFFIFQSSGDTLVIKINNKEYNRLPLSKNTEIVLDNNTVIIKDGYAYVRNANCPDKVCINSGKISKVGQTIACLPNGLVLEVE